MNAKTNTKNLSTEIDPKLVMFCDIYQNMDDCLARAQGEVYVFDIFNREVRKIVYSNALYSNKKLAIEFEPLDRNESSKLNRVLEKLVTHLNSNGLLDDAERKRARNLSSHKLHKENGFGSALGSLGTAVSNGCGSPPDSSWVPELIFNNDCNFHDLCYSTYTNKSTCDSSFLENMRNTADLFAATLSWSNPFGELLAKAELYILAQIYYLGPKLTPAGVAAYCANKGEDCISKEGELVDEPTSSGIHGANGGIGVPVMLPGGSIHVPPPGASDPIGVGANNDGCFAAEYGEVCTGGGCTRWVKFMPCD